MFRNNIKLSYLEFNIVSYGKSKISFKDMKNLFVNCTNLNNANIMLEIMEHKVVDI